MIPDQSVDVSAGLLGLLLELHQQIKDLAGVGSAIGNIAGLDEVRLPTRPLQLRVYELGVLENPDELLVVAVNVADRDDAIDAAPDFGRERCGRDS